MSGVVQGHVQATSMHDVRGPAEQRAEIHASSHSRGPGSPHDAPLAAGLSLAYPRGTCPFGCPQPSSWGRRAQIDERRINALPRSLEARRIRWRQSGDRERWANPCVGLRRSLQLRNSLLQDPELLVRLAILLAVLPTHVVRSWLVRPIVVVVRLAHPIVDRGIVSRWRSPRPARP